MVRKASIGKDGKKKGAWSLEEDKKLRNSVEILQKYGHWNWQELPKYAGLSRCGTSCRFRWMNYLRPNVKRGNYTEDEEDLILKLHQQLGNKWSEIAAKLPERSDNEVKNHWHTHLKKRLRKYETAFEVPKEQSKRKSSALTPKDVANTLPQSIFESSSLTSPTLSLGELSSLIFEVPKGHSKQRCSELAPEDVNSLPQPILESNVPSPTLSFGELSSLISDYAPISDQNWSAEDDINASELMLPWRWSEIAAKLPERSDNEVKNHWHTHLKKRLRKYETAFEVPKEQSKRKSSALTPKDVANTLPQSIFESSSLTSPTLSLGELSSLIFEVPKGHSKQRCSELAPEDVNSLPQPILESNVPSPTLSFGELSSLISDYAPISDQNWSAEDDINSSELMFSEPAGNCWTGQFLVDSFDSYNGFPFQSDVRRSMSPDPEHLQFDESFYQALQDFLEN